MKIGMSFGRCLRDIVQGRVSVDDVIVIAARTMFDTEERMIGVIDYYLYGGDLRGCDRQECIDMALLLYRTGKIHQQRLFSSQSSSFRYPDAWMDVMPAEAQVMENPTVQSAWDNYCLAVKMAG
jgi:hypothetical protein